MKGDKQKSSSEYIARLIKDLRGELDYCLKNGDKKNLVKTIDLELKNLQYLIDSKKDGVKENALNIEKTTEQLKEKISRAEISYQIELSPDNIWLVDANYNIVSTNENFKKNFEIAYGIELTGGVGIIESLPEELKELWKNRYDKALQGERFSVVDQFKISGNPIFSETTFNPLVSEDGIIGVSCFSRDITEQKKFELALAESEKQYKTLISNIPSVFYRCAYDEDWTMELISDEIESLSGYPAEEFIYNKVRSYASIIHPDDTVFIDNIVREGVLLKKNYELEYRLIHADGSIKWVHERGRGNYNDDGTIAWLDGFVNDITQRKNAEFALEQSEEQYRHIFLSMSDLFLKVNTDGAISLATPSIKEILGYNTNEVNGLQFSELLKFPVDYAVLLDALKKKESVRDFETVFITKKGDEATVAFNARNVYDGTNRLVGFEGIARDITERKIAEQSLRERTKELYSIFDNAPMILILADESGDIVNINRATSRFGAKNQQDILNKLSTEAVRCILSINRAEGCGKGSACNNCIIKNTFKETILKKENFHQMEGKMMVQIDNEDMERHVLISTTLIEFENKNRVLLSLDDITEQKAVQEQVKRLSIAVEQSTATIVITDTNGNIEYANPHFEKTTGYSLTEAIGKNPRILKSENTSPDVYEDLWRTILDGKTWQGEFLNVRKDGTEYWENAIISPIYDDAGEMVSFIAIKEDITERKRIQQELIRSEKELRQLNDEKSRYFSILAHDLRGLVGGYYGYTHLLSTEFHSFSSEDLKEQIDLLVKSGQDSLALLDNLLEWARASSGALPITLDNQNLKDEVKSVIDYLKDLAKSKDIKLVHEIDDGLSVYADKNVLTTVIRNLISNSIKFTPADGTITVSALQKDDYTEVSVEDTGIGMDKETLSKLFKAGEDVVRQGTNNEKGTGLGLMICQEMVKRLGGSIYAESEKGKGTRIYFRLPRG